MQNNNSTLLSYSSLLTSHIKDVAKFNDSTKDWLFDATAANLFFKEAGHRIFMQELGLLSNKLSTRSKILAIIMEISNSSQSYLDKCFGISIVLQELIKLVDEE